MWLPFLAATGHNNYTKSSYLYLQEMSDLANTHPDVYFDFCNGLHVIHRSSHPFSGLSSDLVIEQCLMRNLKTSGGLTHGSGMTEAQRNQWTLALPACAAVHNTMQELSGLQTNTGEQNKDFGPSRMARDWKDIGLVRKFFEHQNPFEYGEILCNISNGVHAHVSVNVDNAEDVGNSIIAKMVGTSADQFSFKRKDQVITLATKSSLKIDGETVQIDPQLLFQRLTIAGKSDLEDAMKFELCTYPPALFESADYLNEAHKSNLADAIWAVNTSQEVFIPKKAKYVLDGGALLHRIPWTAGSTYRNIIAKYVDYVIKKHGKAAIIFDGYVGASTKDMTHRRRSKGKKGLTVSFSIDMCLTVKKEDFLSDPLNKQRFIHFLSQNLQTAGCEVVQATADADSLIVQKAIESAHIQDTVLVGDDTDLLVLSLHHLQEATNNLFFAPEPKKNAKKRVWDIRHIQIDLGGFICKHILFLHAFLGCDTTSRLFGIGKGGILKKIKVDAALKQAANVFDKVDASPAEIESAGEKAMVAIYNGKKNDSLNALRLTRYLEKVAKSTSRVEPKSLPPTSAAAKYHSHRVFLQICHWKNPECELLAEAWGWSLTENGYNPIMTDLSPAPEDLLKVVRCNCTTDCGNARCSCQKHGLKCTLACGQCRGSACSNAGIAMIEDEDQLDDES